MKKIFTNNLAVSNLLGYIFAITIVFSIMSFSLITTTSIIDEKSYSAANFEAQNIANQISDAMVNAISISQSLPNAKYYNFLELPDDIAGFDYSVSIDSESIIVTTKDGEVNKKSPNYNTNNLNFEIKGDMSSTDRGISLSYNPPDYVYKLDFGDNTNNIYAKESKEHSPVKTGYSLVTENTSEGILEKDTPWYFGCRAEADKNNSVQSGGLCSFSVYKCIDWHTYTTSIRTEPYIFIDNNNDWIYNEGDRLINNDPDSNYKYAYPSFGNDGPAGLYAFDKEVPFGEPFLFIDNDNDWIFELSDNEGNGLDYYLDYPLLLDPDRDGILAYPTADGSIRGGLYAQDSDGEAYTFIDENDDWAYNETDLSLIENADYYNFKHRIPIKIEKGSDDLTDDIIKLLFHLKMQILMRS